jgi:RHS repeat-associated protein
VALTDAFGQLVEAYAYDPFGRPINGQFSDNRFRYLGRHGIMDEENGLLYVRARYYSTRRGRFITKDPTTGKDGDSQSLNRYIYALNNPVKLIDINGLFSWETFGTGFQDIGSGIGQIGLTGVSAFFAGASGQPLNITTTFLSALEDVNDAFRSIDAGSANIVNAFFDKPTLAVADQPEPLDGIFKSQLWETISTVNTVVSLGSGLNDMSKALNQLDDAATLLDKYSNLLSPETLAAARFQLLTSVNSLYGVTSDLVKLNSIVSKITGDGQSYNTPYIPEIIDPSAIQNLPQRK